MRSTGAAKENVGFYQGKKELRRLSGGNRRFAGQPRKDLAITAGKKKKKSSCEERETPCVGGDICPLCERTVVKTDAFTSHTIKGGGGTILRKEGRNWYVRKTGAVIVSLTRDLRYRLCAHSLCLLTKERGGLPRGSEKCQGKKTVARLRDKRHHLTCYERGEGASGGQREEEKTPISICEEEKVIVLDPDMKANHRGNYIRRT